MFKRLTRSPESDADLHRAALQGRGEAMAELYRRHGPLVYRFTLRMSQNASIAEEITQETFLALLEHTGRFDPSRGSLSTWLCGIARHQLLKHFERNSRYQSADDEDNTYDPPSPEDTPDQRLTREEAVAAVRDGIDTLPLPLKEVLLLCEIEELSYEQASLILAIPVGTVRSRLHRAKLRLQPLLRPVATTTGKETPR
ncbi:RNA polymerase sigma factor [Edaphobacter flagellatus]|uniref:RNA polymerase sigma factor n=1 Tax=Edaphobacter flagellatus TaxID=1933044 RepID=UPI0021B291FB|nr:RNA polymerase sigma factor [Edaphobacter flagellatus]